MKKPEKCGWCPYYKGTQGHGERYENCTHKYAPDKDVWESAVSYDQLPPEWCPLKYNNIKLEIDDESVHIYMEHENDHIPLCYWHIDEWTKDPEVAIAVFRAIDLYYKDVKSLVDKVAVEDFKKWLK